MATNASFAGSGIEGLDEVLGGGFARGRLYLVRGSSGAGKTTLGLQFLIEGARQGEKTLYLGTSETESDIRALAESHGWSLDNVSVRYHETVDLGDEQTMLHPAEVELPRTIESMLEVVNKVGPSRLVIDSLAEIRTLARDELTYRRQLMRLKERFSGNSCTVILIEIQDAANSTLNSIVSGVIELDQSAHAFGSDRRRLRVVKVRAQDFATGRHDFKIRRGGVAVYPRLVAAEHRQAFDVQRVDTGLPQLDDMLRGGLYRGTSTLLLGASGTGKSIIGTQLAVAAANRGERAALYIFDERVQTLMHRAAAIGLPLAQRVEEGLIQIRQIDPAELTVGELSHAVKHAVEQEGVSTLILDSLNGYAYAMPEENLLSVHLHELISYLNQKAVTSVFTMTQHGLVTERGDQAFDVSYVADTVLLFRHFEFAGRLHKALSVYKCRSGPHETTIRELEISGKGVRVGDALTQFQGILSGSPRFIGDTLHGKRREDDQPRGD
jgi:circadian clock protein KaiC